MPYLCTYQTNVYIMSENIQYWINQDGEQSGPLTIDQLQTMPLNENTYVWSAGFDDWKPIGQVPELAQLATATDEPAVQIPPIEPEPVTGQPIESAVVGQPYPPCPPTNMVWAIISTILCCIPLGIVAIIYSNKVSKKYYEGDIAAAHHYSEVSAWWCIGAIVGGIILQPIVSLIQMSLMGA